MRVFPLCLALLPVSAFADDIALVSDVSAVTLYPSGATITREVPFSIPAGQHDLILTDLPRSTPLASVRVEVAGAVMGSVTARRDFVPPRSEDETAAFRAARDRVEKLEADLRQAKGDVEAIRLEAEAAKARVAFLDNLGRGEGVAQMDVDALRDLSAMIGDETLNALQAAHEAEQRADEAERGLKDLAQALEQARQAVTALVPEAEDRAMLAVAVTAQAASEGVMTVTYNTSAAGWSPVYDVRLTRDTGAVVLERGAYVLQNTGENWADVDLTLSTVRPSEQTQPSDIWPWMRRIYDPKELRPRALSRAEADTAGGFLIEEEIAPVAEAPISAGAAFDGLSVTYTYPESVNVASGADRVRLALGTLETEAELVAQAVPLSDQTAFLVAEITNDMGELILPAQEASFYLDGRFIGMRYMDLMAAGDEAALSFGPIEGLRLTRLVEDREEGDRGVLTKSNALTEEVRIEVQNLTGETWPVRLIDRVPVSEQEDLEITWQASPRPSAERYEDKRGVLAWEFDLKGGEAKSVTLSHQIEWPDGMQLQ